MGQFIKKEIAILTVCVTKLPNTRKKWTELKGETDKSTIIIRDLTLHPSDKIRRHEKMWRYKRFGQHSNQVDLIDIYRPFHPPLAKNPFFFPQE